MSPPIHTPAELVISGAPIHTFGAHDETVEAIGIADGIVVEAGPLESIERTSRPDAHHLTLDAAVIMPGFCDTHMHLEKIAAELDMLQLGDLNSVADVLETIEVAAGRTTPGEWIQSFGDDNAWHESRLAEKRLPTRTELDAVAPDHPVYLYRGWDAAALNSRAAEALDDALATDSGWDGDSGHLRSPLARALQERPPSPTDRLDVLGRASLTLLGFGVTTIVDPGLPGSFDDTWRLYEHCKVQGLIGQRLYLMDRFDYHRGFEAELGRVAQSPISRRLDSPGLHGWGLKLLVDGEFENAWMGEGEPQPRPPARRYTADEIAAALRLSLERNWPICFHVMGRGAIEAVIDAVRRLGGAAAFERNQVTLAHAFLPSNDNIRDCADLGIGISVQPLLAYVFETEMLQAWGEHAHRANPYRSMLELGADVAAGSDVLPCEPLRGAAVAVTRTSRLGARLGIDQAISSHEAVSLFTGRTGAYVQRPQLGTLEVGAPADFTAWPRNPLNEPAETWSSLKPTLTAIGGKVVWHDGETETPVPVPGRSTTR